MFQVWQQQVLDFKIDNVLFVLDCVDSLAGDERYIALRKRRAVHRTLTELENRKKRFEVLRSEEIAKADQAAEKELNDAKNRLQSVLDDLRKDLEKGNVDVATVQVRVQNATEAENRKLAQREKEIDREKNEKVRHVKTETTRDIRKIERGIWRWAILIPPLPAIILGIAVMLSRIVDERKGISTDRLRE
jgi:ABC-2 type transport system permease protein